MGRPDLNGVSRPPVLKDDSLPYGPVECRTSVEVPYTYILFLMCLNGYTMDTTDTTYSHSHIFMYSLVGSEHNDCYDVTTATVYF